jgi:putative ABC transport system substrate-binding protein
MGQQIDVVYVSSDREIESAFTTLIQSSALHIGVGVFLVSQRERIVALAARHRIPAIYNVREAVAAGGLMSYAPSIPDAYRQAGIYAGRILKGEKPGDLPVMLPTKFEFVINLKTAKALGLEIPDKFPAANSCNWQRALLRSRPFRASLGRKPIRRGRCGSSLG